MKRIFTTLSFLSILITPMIANDATSHDNKMYIKIENTATPSKISLNLYLENPTHEITAVECYIEVPEGVDFGSGGTLADRITSTHELKEGATENGWFVSISDSNLNTISNSNEPVCTWICDMPTLENTDYTFSAKCMFAVENATDGVICYTVENSSASVTVSDGTVTSIKTIHQNVNLGERRIYNLHGVSLPMLQSGQINIVNGKKVIVK